MTNAEAALAIARALGPVLPLCYTHDVEGTPVCACGGSYDPKSKTMVPHTGHDLGKAPISKLVRNGVNDATTNSATIDRWWREHPRANVGLDLRRCLVFVDPDSPAAYAEAIAQGVEGGMRRSSRNDGFLFKRPKDWPVINITKGGDGTDLELRADGYAAVWGTHANGFPVHVDLTTKLEDAPAWTGDRLKAKAARKAAQEAATAKRREERGSHTGTGRRSPVRLHTRAQRRYDGELVEMRDGHLDRSDSLFFIGLDQAENGADVELVADVVAERDVALGWNKYSGRKDDVEYVRIAEKAVAKAIEDEQAPQLRVTPKAPTDGSMDEVITFAEATAAENTRLRRVIQDQGDRLEILEEIIHSIDDVLARPEMETDDDGNVIKYGPTSDDKIVDIVIARWMPHWRAKREANGEQPTISLGYLAKVTGMPKRRLSKSLDRQSGNAEDGAPFQKVVTRCYIEDEQRWESSLEVRPWGESPAATLRAAATYAMPARPKHGGSQAAAEARWGRCDKHDNDLVQIKGYCPDCGKVVGETMVSVADFDLLNVQVEHLGGEPKRCDGSNSIDVQVEHSERPSLIEFEVARTRPRPDPWRCPDCGALERTVNPDGSWRCQGWGHEGKGDPAVMAGGAE